MNPGVVCAGVGVCVDCPNLLPAGLSLAVNNPPSVDLPACTSASLSHFPSLSLSVSLFLSQHVLKHFMALLIYAHEPQQNPTLTPFFFFFGA